MVPSKDPRESVNPGAVGPEGGILRHAYAFQLGIRWETRRNPPPAPRGECFARWLLFAGRKLPNDLVKMAPIEWLCDLLRQNGVKRVQRDDCLPRCIDAAANRDLDAIEVAVIGRWVARRVSMPGVK
jgi:hypothetical protein